MVLYKRRRSGSFKKPVFHEIPKKRPPRLRLRLRVDFMNCLIVLVLGINLVLVFFGIRQCSKQAGRTKPGSGIAAAGSQAPEPQSPKSSIVPPEVTEKRTGPIQIEVLNGCGVPKIADRFTVFLREKGFDVVKTANYDNFNVLKTLVIDRKGNAKNAARVAEVIGLKKSEVIQESHDMYMVDATVVLGRDFRSLSSWKSLEKKSAPQ